MNHYIHNILLENINKVLAESYEDYADFINSIISDANKFLSQYGLSVVYNAKYDFSWGAAKNCLAIYQYRSVKNNGRMRISINFPALEDCMRQNDIDDIETQIEISIYHEIGHGIVEWIKKLRRKDTQCGTKIFRGKLLKDLRSLLINEEDAVEEFGAHKSGWYGHSEIGDFLDEYKDILLQIDRM